MIDGLHRVREEFHNKILIARSIETILLSSRFERLWNHSDKEQKEAAKKCILAKDKNGIVKWMCNHTSIDVGEQPLRELYPIAQKLRIKNYSRLRRDDLIIEIMKAQNAQQRTHVDSDSKTPGSDVKSPNLLQSEGGTLSGS
jgi:hypothetical protein